VGHLSSPSSPPPALPLPSSIVPTGSPPRARSATPACSWCQASPWPMSCGPHQSRHRVVVPRQLGPNHYHVHPLPPWLPPDLGRPPPGPADAFFLWSRPRLCNVAASISAEIAQSPIDGRWPYLSPTQSPLARPLPQLSPAWHPRWIPIDDTINIRLDQGSISCNGL
jgi:hypothetical protein